MFFFFIVVLFKGCVLSIYCTLLCELADSFNSDRTCFLESKPVRHLNTSYCNSGGTHYITLSFSLELVTCIYFGNNKHSVIIIQR